MNKVEVSVENYQKFKVVAEEINSKLEKVREATKFHSSPRPTYEHEDFKSLVKMGDRIVPYIFYISMQEGWDWTLLMLLGEILPEVEQPEAIAGRFMHQVHHWLGWYLSSKYSESDVYFGLVD